MEQFYTILWSVVGVLATGLASWVVVVVTNFFNQKIKDRKAAKWASDLFQIIMGAVQSVFQSFVDTLKKNGQFDEAAQKEAKERAYRIITGQLTQELREYIEANFGDMREYLMNQIESAIYSLKR